VPLPCDVWRLGDWEPVTACLYSHGRFSFSACTSSLPHYSRSSRYIFSPFYLFHYRAARFSSAQALINAIPLVNSPSFRISAQSNHFIIAISFSRLDSYGLGERGSIPGRGKRFLSIGQRPDRLWGPPSLLSNSHRKLYPGGRVKRQGRQADHTALSTAEVMIDGAITPLHHTPSWHSVYIIMCKENFIFFFLITEEVV
jgi:hypothetical protein